MESAKRKPFLIRIWQGFWALIDGARRLVINIIFLLLLIALLVFLFSDKQALFLENETALVVNPYGVIVEQYSVSPYDRALSVATNREQPETRLRDLIKAIEAARDDRRISRLILIPDYIWGVGLASLQELSAAIQSFKSSGKPVIALAENLSQQQYYFASLADEIWMNPEGLVWIDGYSRYRNFYKETLDKLAVEINLFRVGEYKSAMEPYIRSDMSDEAKEANLFWLNSLWQQYLEGVAVNRGLPVDVLANAINNYAQNLELTDGDFAQLALDLGLVDRLVSRPDARSELMQLGAADQNGLSFRQVDFRAYAAATDQEPKGAGTVAVIVAEGNIVSGDTTYGVVSADATSRLIRYAVADESVKALVLRVNSPGGDAFASEVVRRELQAAREAGKSVVVSFGDVAASGGYWIGLAADEIWTQPATITGSIGIFGMIPTFPETLAKAGIYNDGVGTTPLAGSLRLERSLGEPVKQILQSTIEHGYQAFLQTVSNARQMSTTEVDQVARGRVWSGVQALDRGLVDHTGSLRQAAAAAARHAGLGEDYRMQYVEEGLSSFEQLVVRMTGSVLTKLDLGGADPLSGWMRSTMLQNLLRDLSLISADKPGFSIYAHCLCGIE